MQDAVGPAFKYVCKVLAQSRPGTLGLLWRWCDELYLLADSFLQAYFIWRYGGTFAENFYSLCRVGCSRQHLRVQRAWQLSTKCKVLSVLCVVLLPYVWTKLDKLHQNTQDEWEGTASAGGTRVKLTLWGYPVLSFAWEALAFLCRLQYLFVGDNSAAFYSPLLWVAGVTLVRREEEEGPQEESSLVEKLSANVFPFALFGLKLLQWWYSSGRSEAASAFATLPVPPPPPLATNRPAPNPQACPLCLQKRHQPTALSTSGYVFCYPCIEAYLQHSGRCPVTNIPSNQTNLVRLYVQTVDHAQS